MRRAVAVALVFVAMLGTRLLRTHPDSEPAGTALALGFILIMALVAGDVLRRFRLPRLTGYLLFGVVVGPYLGNLVTDAMVRELQAITGVATALIALIAGLTINFERLQRRVSGFARLTATTLGVATAGLFVLAWLAWPWLPVAPEATGAARVSMAALLAVIVISFSPTMTAAVISETGARGRFVDLVLAMVVIADLAVLVAFSLLMQAARPVLERGDPFGADVLVRLGWEIGGALAFGSLVGALLALYLRYVAREATLVLLVTCMVLSQVGQAQGFAPLLASMAAGLVIQNVAVAQGDALKSALQGGVLPVLVVFFVAVGASLRLDTLAASGLVAAGLGLVRVLMIRLGVRLGTQVAGMAPASTTYLWTGLISQAGITLGLAAALAAEFPGWGTRIQVLLVALIVLDELVGPVAFRHGLQAAGEIDASGQRPLLVVSNREPVLHDRDADGAIRVSRTTGGVAVALDSLMRDRGGVWIAHGAGSADRDTVDGDDKLWLPPERPMYQLRRLWIEEERFNAYYGGFANEGLWPLCHLVDVRPKFRATDWEAYQSVNAQFAEAIARESAAADAPVFIQDYHLTLVAHYLRGLRPSARSALFWHIPWPYPDRLRICPWRREVLRGLLANDFLAFQVERDRHNFVLACEDELGAEVEADGASVRCAGRSTTVVAVPIGVDYDRIQQVVGNAALPLERQRLTSAFRLDAAIIGLGVDRLDYTKGIPERLEALDRVFRMRPDLRGQMTFVQIGVPSRSEIDSYGAIAAEIDRRVAEINATHGVPGQPPPIYYHKSALGLTSLVALYRLAHYCIVSSLADGMNLVAKEFVAARDDEDGVLVLSAMAGAAQELPDALIVNPYDADAFARAIVQGIEMSADERGARMRAMRRVVAGRDVFGWASDILDGLESLWTKPLQYAARAPEDAPV